MEEACHQCQGRTQRCCKPHLPRVSSGSCYQQVLGPQTYLGNGNRVGTQARVPSMRAHSGTFWQIGQVKSCAKDNA